MTESLMERIKRHEGLRLKPYRDSMGNPTIGYGHFLKKPISRNAALTILRDDVILVYIAYLSLPGSVTNGLSQNRKEVLMEMIFNLGLNGTLNFKRMMLALAQKEYGRAANEMLDSRWAEQVKGRARELAEMMRKG